MYIVPFLLSLLFFSFSLLSPSHIWPILPSTHLCQPENIQVMIHQPQNVLVSHTSPPWCEFSSLVHIVVCSGLQLLCQTKYVDFGDDTKQVSLGRAKYRTSWATGSWCNCHIYLTEWSSIVSSKHYQNVPDYPNQPNHHWKGTCVSAA
jgi:hypothetical protein